MKLFFKSICSLLIILFVILLFEAVIYYRILSGKKSLYTADAIVIFNEALNRNKEGYRLANEGLAPLLIISPADIVEQKRYDSVYGCTGTWKHLTEDRADTTFQNALLTSRLIQRHQLKKVILVTDSWHMPRSYLLLRILLTGSNVEILPWETEDKFCKGPLMKWSPLEKRLMYNELIKFWGSFYEMGLYFTSDELPEKSLKERPWVEMLRKILLLGA